MPDEPRRPPTSRWRRSLPLGALTARTGVGRAAQWVRLRGAGEDEKVARELEFHARQAARYASLMGDMKGAVMKLGQLLSFVDTAGLIPEAYRDVYQQALASLQADAPPMDERLVAEMVEAELGRGPDEIFERFSPRPIAAASIGQVHAATLHDGTEVAVKVQYPGVAEAIRADLDNTEALATMMRLGLSLLPGFAPNLDVKPLVEELRDRIGDELDYRLELANQQMFVDLYRQHPFIRVPALFPELSTARVLTMEMVDGRRWQSALESPQELRDRWGEVIFRFVFGSLFRAHVFNADPHPGNYLFHEDGTVTFLDFGCVKRFRDRDVAGFFAAADAAIRGDADELYRVMGGLGFIPESEKRMDPARLLAWQRPAMEPIAGGRFTYTPEFAAEMAVHHYDPAGPFSDVTRRFNVPKDFLFINRIVIGLNSVLGGLRATADWRAVEDCLRGGEPATELGRQERAWLDLR